MQPFSSHPPCCRDVQHGFTLIELVLVIVLTGVLAIYVVPSFNSADYNARGFHDQMLALLRYGHKSAVAQRRTVCVGFTADTVTLRVVAAAESADCTASQPLAGAGGSSTVQARAGVQFEGVVPAAFSFDALGQPTGARQIRVEGTGRTITVEAFTGFVHD
jgi:MSHA pilin protein MshC